jgi:hypothetical protein
MTTFTRTLTKLDELRVPRMRSALFLYQHDFSNIDSVAYSLTKPLNRNHIASITEILARYAC